MRTLPHEFARLASHTFALWWRWLPLLAAWFLAGWTIQVVTTHAAALLGGQHRGWATVVFVLGVTCQVLATVGMVWMLKPTLLAPRRLAASPAGGTRVGVPDAVVRRERLTDVLLLAIGPFLAVYAVWNVVEKWVGDLFLWNIAVNPLGVADDSWSVSTSPTNLTLYATVGVVAFGLRLAYDRLTRRADNALVRLPLVFLEGLWTFALFFITLLGVAQFQSCFARRRVVVGGIDAWHGFLAWLPDLRLPFDLTLPEVLAATATWLAETLWPAFWVGLCLPLVWLALTATVLGWRDFNLRALLAGRLPARFRDVRPRSAWAQGVASVAGLLTADLRDKYVPVVHALSLVWRSGPLLLGSFVVLYTAIQALGHWVHAGILYAAAPDTQVEFVGLMRLYALPGELLAQTLTPVLLVTALDRGLLGALRLR